MLDDLKRALSAHTGQFHCSAIRGTETKVVHFRHLVGEPVSAVSLPPIGRLAECYATFGSIVFYADEVTGEAAVRIAHPDEWETLRNDLGGWFSHLSDEEKAEELPDWYDSALVIGEIPRTGNYVLMPTEGEDAGHVFEWDHDGYEFKDLGSDLVDYVTRLLTLDDERLTSYASHMRFIDPASKTQWWIEEMRDSEGRTVSTTE